MKYTKPALSFEQQAQRLLDRGIDADKENLTRHLSVVNYYRLSAYWYPFKHFDETSGIETFIPGTTFELIWNRYTFDRRLRLLVMDAIERIEVACLRTRMVEYFTLHHGPFGYKKTTNFDPEFDHGRLIYEINNNVDRSKEEFVLRYRRKYKEEEHLPLWMVAEVMTFGQLFTFYRFLHREEKKKLAREFVIFPPVFESWLHTLLFTRNTCAHHARLWNREIPIKPLIPNSRHGPEWHDPVKVDNQRVFAILTILRYMLDYITPESDWGDRLVALLHEYDSVPLNLMGFPDNWQESPLW